MPCQDSPVTAGTVSFNNLVEVEALVVPVCPVHHGKFMQYEALKELLATWRPEDCQTEFAIVLTLQ